MNKVLNYYGNPVNDRSLAIGVSGLSWPKHTPSTDPCFIKLVCIDGSSSFQTLTADCWWEVRPRSSPTPAAALSAATALLTPAAAAPAPQWALPAVLATRRLPTCRGTTWTTQQPSEGTTTWILNCNNGNNRYFYIESPLKLSSSPVQVLPLQVLVLVVLFWQIMHHKPVIHWTLAQG